jgi:hypothetical protein
VSSPPDIIKLLHNFADYYLIIGDNTGLEIPFVYALGTHTRAGKIGTAAVSESTVDDNGFKVNSRA